PAPEPPPAPAPGQAPAQPQAMIDQPQRAPELPDDAAAERRQRLFRELNAVLPTRDTPRGLVVTVGDTYFHSTTLTPSVYSRLAAVASMVRNQPGLAVEVDGHTDDRGDPVYAERLSAERAGMIRGILVRQGLSQSTT